MACNIGSRERSDETVRKIAFAQKWLGRLSENRALGAGYSTRGVHAGSEGITTIMYALDMNETILFAYEWILLGS